MTALPCPFCGGTKIVVVEGSTFRWRHARCEECGGQSGEVRIQTLGEGTREQWEADARVRVIEEWNTRAKASDSAEIERLRAELADMRAEVDAWRAKARDKGDASRANLARDTAMLRQALGAINDLIDAMTYRIDNPATAMHNGMVTAAALRERLIA